MESDSTNPLADRKPRSWPRMLGVAAAFGVILLRLIQGPFRDSWKDFSLIIAVSALVALSGINEKVKTRALTVTISYLIAVYLLGQVPLTLAHLGVLR